MSTDEGAVRQEWHRKFAVELFNATWELLDKSDRSAEEDLSMVHAAHASRFHWGEIGTPLEFERGEWQISRVYAVLGMAGAALRHASACLEICLKNDIGDFDIAFAHEAVARACVLSDDTDGARSHIELGAAAAEAIADENDRNYYLSELDAVRAMLQQRQGPKQGTTEEP